MKAFYPSNQTCDQFLSKLDGETADKEQALKENLQQEELPG